ISNPLATRQDLLIRKTVRDASRLLDGRAVIARNPALAGGAGDIRQCEKLIRKQARLSFVSPALAGWCILLTALGTRNGNPRVGGGASRRCKPTRCGYGRVVGSDQDASRAGLRRGVAVPQPGRQPPA